MNSNILSLICWFWSFTPIKPAAFVDLFHPLEITKFNKKRIH